MKRLKRYGIVIVAGSMILITMSFYFYQMLFTPNIGIEKSRASVTIPKGATFTTVQDSLFSKNLVTDPVSFSFLAKLMDYDHTVKPGYYEFDSAQNNISAIRMLRSGAQTPVHITFHSVRLLEELPEKLCQNIGMQPNDLRKVLVKDSTARAFGFSRETFISMFIPNTYEVYWTINPKELLEKMHTEYQAFWNRDRRAKAAKLGLTPVEVSTLASLVQAEQLAYPEERPVIAGLYLNRLRKGMKLDSDPTLIYASGDFSIKRVLNEHKTIDSPYNTYKYSGLPPGPINLPEISSIDAVLNYQANNYLYMCARDDLSGYHNFASSLSQHLNNARKYQRALNEARIYR